jgi:hypothetical protein
VKLKLSAAGLSALASAINHLSEADSKVRSALVEVDGHEFRIERDDRTNELVMEIKQ